VESSTFVLGVPGFPHIPLASRLQVYRLLVQTGPEGLVVTRRLFLVPTVAAEIGTDTLLETAGKPYLSASKAKMPGGLQRPRAVNLSD
jgi:hypothetical protein